MNFCTTILLVTIAIQYTWALPKLETGPKPVTKPVEKAIDSKFPVPVKFLNKPIILEKPEPKMETPKSVEENSAKKKMPISQSSSYESSESFDSHMIEVPENLSSVDWQCVLKVIQQLITCLVPTNAMVNGYGDAHTVGDLYAQGQYIGLCVTQAAIGISACINSEQITETYWDHSY